MNFKQIIKHSYGILAGDAVLSLILSLLFIRTIGMKDTAMIFIATFLLLFEIYLIFKDKKYSMLLFILSFPILVTARKITYYDTFSVKFNYESIYITVLFIMSLKDIAQYIKKSAKQSKSDLWFLMFTAAFIIFALNSCVYSNDALDSLSITYISVIVPVMFMLAVAADFTKDDRIKVYFALIGGLDLSCLYGFMQIITNRISLRKISSERELLTFGYHNINIFAGILTLILPFIVDMLLYKKKSRREKYFLLISLFISLCALFITYTRGAWLAFILSVFIILISKKYRKVVYGLCILMLAMFKPVFSYIISRGSSTNTFLQNESSIARIQSIFTSADIIAHNLFGTGAGTYAKMYKEYAKTGYLMMPQSFRVNINVANYMLEAAHNLWLQIGVELGVLCALIFLIIFINRIKLIFKNYSENRANFTAIIVYLIFSVLTGIEFNHKGVITETLIIWLIFSIISLSSKEGCMIETAD